MQTIWCVPNGSFTIEGIRNTFVGGSLGFLGSSVACGSSRGSSGFVGEVCSQYRNEPQNERQACVLQTNKTYLISVSFPRVNHRLRGLEPLCLLVLILVECSRPFKRLCWARLPHQHLGLLQMLVPGQSKLS